MKTAILDADGIVYIVGFGNDNMSLRYQCEQIDDFIEKILDTVDADNYIGYLTGPNNFRDDVATFQPYKGNRDKTHRPRYYKELRQHLINEHGCEIIEGMEADDACGIVQCSGKFGECVICSLDKDLLMIPGLHYNYKNGEHTYVTNEEAWRFFYTQTLTGDPSDNIPGLFKVTGKRATKAIKDPLEDIEDWKAMDEYVWQTYVEANDNNRDEEELASIFKEIKQLLWIRRK